MGAPVDKDVIETALRFRRIADQIAAGNFPEAEDVLAGFLILRQLVDDDAADRIPDARALRRSILRRMWNVFYPGKAITVAAKLIASDWHMAGDVADDPLPGTKAAYFARLARGGIGPKSWNTIWADLDASQDDYRD
ncbi:hypothetical protein [Mesorhizobium sp.]|uniref:hypothetical protein n=1 Tax=Mesorhizobium sp. TaxID=1871066 RepID=UPI00121ED73F|nr:hypothetical protein [Mesorhizobium sp.]TIO36537.1 MAG: hypothetical protein E5X89_00535 [Mesorhizobium sp.]